MAFKIQMTVDEKAKLDEAKAEREQEAMYNKVVAEEKRRYARIKEEKEKTKAYLAEQMRAKEVQREAERAEYDRIRQQLQHDIKDAEVKEKMRKQKKRETELAHRKELEAQIVARQNL